MEEQRDDAGEGAVVGEIDEFTFAYDANHPLAGHASGKEGGHEAYYEGHGANGSAQVFALHDFEHVEEGFAEDGRDDHKEGELCHARLFVSKEESGGDGGAGAAESGEDGHGLRESDDEGVAEGYFLTLTRTGIIGEGEEDCRDEKASAYYGQTGAKDFFYFVLKEHADDADGDHRHNDVEHVALVGVEALESACGAVQRTAHAFEDVPYFTAEDDDGAQHGGYMNEDGEDHAVLAVHAEEFGGDGKVSAAAHGEIFRESLQQAHEKGLEGIHLIVYILNGSSEERYYPRYSSVFSISALGVLGLRTMA